METTTKYVCRRIGKEIFQFRITKNICGYDSYSITVTDPYIPSRNPFIRIYQFFTVKTHWTGEWIPDLTDYKTFDDYFLQIMLKIIENRETEQNILKEWENLK